MTHDLSRARIGEHVVRLKSIPDEEMQVLLTELLVHVYPTSEIQDS